MRALVTGANGFVGRWLTAHLTANGDEVWRAVGRPLQEEDPQTTVADLRIPDEAARICQWAMPDAIYHLAAVAFGPDAQRSPAKALEITVGGTINLMRAASLLPQLTTVLIPSSGEVYGHPSTSAPLIESDPVRPANVYGCTKAAQELVAMTYHRAGTVRVVVGRAFNHIGPGQRDAFVVSSFAHQLSAAVAGQTKPILRVGNLDAERDFTDVRDVVAAYRLLVAHDHSGDTFNIASGVAVPIRTILNHLIELSGQAVEIQIDPSRVRQVDPPRIVGDAGRLREATGWAPRYGLLDTLRDVWGDAMVRQSGQQPPGA